MGWMRDTGRAWLSLPDKLSTSIQTPHVLLSVLARAGRGQKGQAVWCGSGKEGGVPGLQKQATGGQSWHTAWQNWAQQPKHHSLVACEMDRSTECLQIGERAMVNGEVCRVWGQVEPSYGRTNVPVDWPRVWRGGHGFWLCHLLTVWLWASPLFCLELNILTCKVGSMLPLDRVVRVNKVWGGK